LKKVFSVFLMEWELLQLLYGGFSSADALAHKCRTGAGPRGPGANLSFTIQIIWTVHVTHPTGSFIFFSAKKGAGDAAPRAHL
jgi:hypothetical protein